MIALSIALTIGFCIAGWLANKFLDKYLDQKFRITNEKVLEKMAADIDAQVQKAVAVKVYGIQEQIDKLKLNAGMRSR